MTWEEACRILGFSVNATPAEIKNQWLYKANLLHPDKTANLPENMRIKAEEDFKQASIAYNFLTDPKNNPHRNPPKLDVRPKRISFKEVEAGSKKSTTVLVKSAGGPYTKFWMDDSPVPWLHVTAIKSLTQDTLPLEVTIEASGIGKPDQQHQCKLLIRLENEQAKSKDETFVIVTLSIKTILQPGSEKCPRDQANLLFDPVLSIWKCPNCKGIFTADDLYKNTTPTLIAQTSLPQKPNRHRWLPLFRRIALVALFLALLSWQWANLTGWVIELAHGTYGVLGWGLVLILLAILIILCIIFRRALAEFIRHYKLYLWNKWLGAAVLLCAIWGVLGLFSLGGLVGTAIIGDNVVLALLRVAGLFILSITLFYPKIWWNILKAIIKFR
jgi:hypothetical protein